MTYRVGIDLVEPNNWVAYVLDLPGCFARGQSQREAQSRVDSAISDYLLWRHGFSPTDQDFHDWEVVESHASEPEETGYLVNAFFDDDRRALTTDDIDEGGWLLSRSREDLLTTVQPLGQDTMDQKIPGERQENITGIIDHIAAAELWYLEGIDMAFEREVPAGDALARLRQVREHLNKSLPSMIGHGHISERKGELWSARKVLRRALWHERVHTWQIRNYIARG